MPGQVLTAHDPGAGPSVLFFVGSLLSIVPATFSIGEQVAEAIGVLDCILTPAFVVFAVSIITTNRKGSISI
jgi:hypothetical protein